MVCDKGVCVMICDKGVCVCVKLWYVRDGM